MIKVCLANGVLYCVFISYSSFYQVLNLKSLIETLKMSTQYVYYQVLKIIGSLSLKLLNRLQLESVGKGRDTIYKMNMFSILFLMLCDVNNQDIKDCTLFNRGFFTLMTSTFPFHFSFVPLHSIFPFILNYIKHAEKKDVRS